MALSAAIAQAVHEISEPKLGAVRGFQQVRRAHPFVLLHPSLVLAAGQIMLFATGIAAMATAVLWISTVSSALSGATQRGNQRLSDWNKA